MTAQTYGPYTPVKQAGNTYYVSGQVGIDPNTKSAQSDIKSQTKQVLDNMKHVLAESGLSMNDVVKVTIYLTDMEQFGDVNAIYETYFTAPRPARACVGVSDLPHVGNAPLVIEMDAVAYKEQV